MPERRLSAATYDLARRGLSAEFGRATANADIRIPDGNGLSGEARYAAAIELIVRNSPLRILPDDMLAGAASYREAARHLTPILGEFNASQVTVDFDRVLKKATVGYEHA